MYILFIWRNSEVIPAYFFFSYTVSFVLIKKMFISLPNSPSFCGYPPRPHWGPLRRDPDPWVRKRPLQPSRQAALVGGQQDPGHKPAADGRTRFWRRMGDQGDGGGGVGWDGGGQEGEEGQMHSVQPGAGGGEDGGEDHLSHMWVGWLIILANFYTRKCSK